MTRHNSCFCGCLATKNIYVNNMALLLGDAVNFMIIQLKYSYEYLAVAV